MRPLVLASLPAALVLCWASCSKKGGAPPGVPSSPTRASTSGAAGGANAAGTGGAGGIACSEGGNAAKAAARLGVRGWPRPDDNAAITALGAKPFDPGEEDPADKNALYRVELEVGPALDTPRLFGVDRTYRALGAGDWPNAYDVWTASQRQLILSMEPTDQQGNAVAYCDLAGNADYDAAIASAAARLRSFVDVSVADRLYFAWGHEPSQNAATLTVFEDTQLAGPTLLPVWSRPGVGVRCPIAPTTELTFITPTGGSVLVIVNQQANVGDQTIAVSAQFPGLLPEGSVAIAQSPTDQQASYVASFKKVRAAMESTWGAWSGEKKLRWTWIIGADELPQASAWYPGDGVVDAIGGDIYNRYGVYSNGGWSELADAALPLHEFDLAHGRKDVVLAEIGSLEGIGLTLVADAAPGSMVQAQIRPLAGSGQLGDEVAFYDGTGALWATAKLAEAAPQNAGAIDLDQLAMQLPSGTRGRLRPAGKSKAQWIDNARNYLESCWPEVKAAVWFTGPPSSFWLEQPPEGSPEALGAFKLWAADPYFGGG